MGLIQSWRNRPRQDQVLDALGLLTQGSAVPALATYLGGQLLPHIFTGSAQLQIPNWVLFLLPFTLVDYLYYWNHRLFHSRQLWFMHQVHHTTQHLDVWATSRNSIWTPLLLIYVWFHACLIFFTRETQAYVYGLWLMGALDLWRHSGWKTPSLLKPLGAFMILPEDHEWHHSLEKSGVNYGANLNIWDRLHGTFYRSEVKPKNLGTHTRGKLSQEIFFPWRIRL